jgi:hypothetical protein
MPPVAHPPGDSSGLTGDPVKSRLKDVGASVSRYVPSRQYVWAGFVAWGLAAFSGWVAVKWTPALIAFVLCLASSAVMIYLALRPRIEIRDKHLVIGKRAILWADIRRVDRTAWMSPLVVRITLFDDTHFLLVYPGDLDSANSLLRHLRRCAREALIDGAPYHQFWGEELLPAPGRKDVSSPRYRLLRPEDEAEVERLYLRLKTVGRLDPRNSSPDEK